MTPISTRLESTAFAACHPSGCCAVACGYARAAGLRSDRICACLRNDALRRQSRLGSSAMGSPALTPFLLFSSPAGQTGCSRSPFHLARRALCEDQPKNKRISQLDARLQPRFFLAAVAPSSAHSEMWQGYTGTLRYMAPEVISQRIGVLDVLVLLSLSLSLYSLTHPYIHTGNYTEKCDIYSASLILWYIATVRRPPNNDISKIKERPQASLARWPAFEALLHQMWAEVREGLEAAATSM